MHGVSFLKFPLQVAPVSRFEPSGVELHNDCLPYTNRNKPVDGTAACHRGVAGEADILLCQAVSLIDRFPTFGTIAGPLSSRVFLVLFPSKRREPIKQRHGVTTQRYWTPSWSV